MKKIDKIVELMNSLEDEDLNENEVIIYIREDGRTSLRFKGSERENLDTVALLASMAAGAIVGDSMAYGSESKEDAGLLYQKSVDAFNEELIYTFANSLAKVVGLDSEEQLRELENYITNYMEQLEDLEGEELDDKPAAKTVPKILH